MEAPVSNRAVRGWMSRGWLRPGAFRQPTTKLVKALSSVLKIFAIFGTRPEPIKMAPVLRELGRHAEMVESRVCVTARHREMPDQVLRQFVVKPDHDLDLMAEKERMARAANPYGDRHAASASFRFGWTQNNPRGPCERTC